MQAIHALPAFLQAGRIFTGFGVGVLAVEIISVIGLRILAAQNFISSRTFHSKSIMIMLGCTLLSVFFISGAVFAFVYAVFASILLSLLVSGIISAALLFIHIHALSKVRDL